MIQKPHFYNDIDPIFDHRLVFAYRLRPARFDKYESQGSARQKTPRNQYLFACSDLIPALQLTMSSKWQLNVGGCIVDLQNEVKPERLGTSRTSFLMTRR